MDYADAIKRLKSIDAGPWHLHEKVVCRELQLKPREGLSVRRQLSELIKALKRGKAGIDHDGNEISSDCGIVDLKDSVPNALGVHYDLHGKLEEFPADSLASESTVTCRPRYFSFSTTRAPVKIQVGIANVVTGEDTKRMDDKTAKRRADTWRAWYNRDEDNGGKSFEENDLPTIAEEYQGYLLSEDELNNDQLKKRTFLRIAGDEIRRLLRVCNKTQSKTRAGQPRVATVSPDGGSMPQEQDDESGAIVVSGAPAFDDDDDDDDDKEQEFFLPPRLKLKDLRDLMAKDKLEELASIEFALHLRYVVNVGEEYLGSWKAALDEFKKAQVPIPKSMSLLMIMGLSNAASSRAWRNMQQARKELLAKIPGRLFQPQDDELLYDWIECGKRYSNGERLPAVNYEQHAVTNQRVLTEEAAHIIRHIIWTHKIPVSRFPSLWQCFSVLLLRRPLQDEEFSSMDTLRYRCHRLMLIDRHLFLVAFEEWITTPSKYGFFRLWFKVMDDSDIDVKRHVVLMSIHHGDLTDAPKPGFELLTASEAATADSDGNADLNVTMGGREKKKLGARRIST